MKKLLILFFFLIQSINYGQTKTNPLIIIDAQKMGFMNDLKKEMDALNPNDISTITVYKDSISKIYNSTSGVIIITTKKYILDTFYSNFIENSSLKENIPSSEKLAFISIINADSKSKNQPYDELYKYIYTNTINDKIKKLSKIVFLKPEEAIKINPDWINGAIEIDSEEQ